MAMGRDDNGLMMDDFKDSSVERLDDMLCLYGCPSYDRMTKAFIAAKAKSELERKRKMRRLITVPALLILLIVLVRLAWWLGKVL